MATVHDVAAYVLQQLGGMTAMKLQKLCYYAQAWHLVWEEGPLFEERIEAWANGPVVPVLYRAHRGRLHLEPGDISGEPTALTTAERESVDAVLGFYGQRTAAELSELTHREDPWRCAREAAGLAPGERGTAEIPVAEVYEYYDGLVGLDDSFVYDHDDSCQ